MSTKNFVDWKCILVPFDVDVVVNVVSSAVVSSSRSTSVVVDVVVVVVAVVVVGSSVPWSLSQTNESKPVLGSLYLNILKWVVSVNVWEAREN